MIENARERLVSLGYTFKDGDEMLLNFAIQKVTSIIKNDCNVLGVPNGLESIAIDMAVGEFLFAKKTYSPNDITGLDLEAAVKQIQTGDTNVTFALGAGSSTPEQRFDTFVNYLLNYGRDQFSVYRKIKW